MSHKQVKHKITPIGNPLNFTSKGAWIGLIAYLILIAIVIVILIFG